MRLATETSSDKLRGGFYTPPDMVQLALDRGLALVETPEVSVLEPSAGDGAFVRGLAAHPARHRIARVTAIELDPHEAAASDVALADSGLSGEVISGDFLDVALRLDQSHSLLVGNPPYIRYQFLSADTKDLAAQHAARMGIEIKGVSNLWIPLTLAALSRLGPGGAFALVLPTEFLTGISARAVREWLRINCSHVTIDLFPPHEFPSVLQQVAIVSGKLAATPSKSITIQMVEQHRSSRDTRWTHKLAASIPNWTRLLLTDKEASVLDALDAHPEFAPLNEVAKFEVSIVTGANAFFTLSQADCDEYDLGDNVVALLPRTRHAPGLVYAVEEYNALRQSADRSLLLNLSPDDELNSGVVSYLDRGISEELHKRYKCQVREPWYSVPGVRSGSLLLSKRVHHYPRIIRNLAGVVTTDTIYRGEVLTGDISADDFAAGFHNSLTLLTAEVEGRSFGGGVLELVPSEIARLRVPKLRMGRQLAKLDKVARNAEQAGQPSQLIDATDRSLVATRKVDAQLIGLARVALDKLAARRHART